jgi:hypothetical protein
MADPAHGNGSCIGRRALTLSLGHRATADDPLGGTLGIAQSADGRAALFAHLRCSATVRHAPWAAMKGARSPTHVRLRSAVALHERISHPQQPPRSGSQQRDEWCGVGLRDEAWGSAAQTRRGSPPGSASKHVSCSAFAPPLPVQNSPRTRHTDAAAAQPSCECTPETTSGCLGVTRLFPRRRDRSDAQGAAARCLLSWRACAASRVEVLPLSAAPCSCSKRR